MKQKNIDFNEPLNKLDTETETYGCRHTNPSICKWNSLPNACAFVKEDNICLKPSMAWKKQYQKLKERE